MTRVVGIDPGTVTVDVCGIVDGQVYLDTSRPTAEALSDPGGFIDLLTAPGLPDLIVGPSGYGLPLRRAAEATEGDLRLAFLAQPHSTGGAQLRQWWSRSLESHQNRRARWEAQRCDAVVDSIRPARIIR